MAIVNSLDLLKYKKGFCQGLPCDKIREEVPLIGYCYFNNQKQMGNQLVSTGTQTKMEYCLHCYLYFKPMMDKQIELERQQGITPLPWFYFYYSTDREKFDNIDFKYERS